jgi:hypothetical protein
MLIKRSAVPAAGRGGLYVYDMLRLPQFLHNGGKVGRLAALYSHIGSWYSFLLEAESTPGP